MPWCRCGRASRDFVLVDGCVPALQLHDFKRAVEALGGRPFRRMASPWSVPLIGAVGAPVDKLSETTRLADEAGDDAGPPPGRVRRRAAAPARRLSTRLRLVLGSGPLHLGRIPFAGAARALGSSGRARSRRLRGVRTKTGAEVPLPLLRDRSRAHAGGQSDVPLRRGATRPARPRRISAGPDLAMASVRELGQRGALAVRRLRIHRPAGARDDDRDATAGSDRRRRDAPRFLGRSSRPPGAAASPNDWYSRTGASFREGLRSIRPSGVSDERQQHLRGRPVHPHARLVGLHDGPRAVGRRSDPRSFEHVSQRVSARRRDRAARRARDPEAGGLGAREAGSGRAAAAPALGVAVREAITSVRRPQRPVRPESARRLLVETGLQDGFVGEKIFRDRPRRHDRGHDGPF